jgi:hypothetical protein
MSTVAGWDPKKLTELADYINGYAFKPEDWGKEGLPIIRIEQLKNPDALADYFNGKLPPSKISVILARVRSIRTRERARQYLADVQKNVRERRAAREQEPGSM